MNYAQGVRRGIETSPVLAPEHLGGFPQETRTYMGGATEQFGQF